MNAQLRHYYRFPAWLLSMSRLYFEYYKADSTFSRRLALMLAARPRCQSHIELTRTLVIDYPDAIMCVKMADVTRAKRLSADVDARREYLAKVEPRQ